MDLSMNENKKTEVDCFGFYEVSNELFVCNQGHIKYKIIIDHFITKTIEK